MPGKPPVRIWVGTRKGAFVFSSKDRKKWEPAGHFFGGQEVHHVAQDPRDPKRYYAAVGNAWFGPHLHVSSDGGKKWEISEKGLEVKGIVGKFWQVNEKGMELKESPDAPLKRIWHIAPGADDEPGVVYLGADPGVLFRSGDNGANWEMVDGLCNHPTREKWNPGAGGMMVHSIQCLGKGRLIVGISAAGAFRSSDSGKTWEPFNGNVLVSFGPEKFPEVGQCVHKMKAHPQKSRSAFSAESLRHVSRRIQFQKMDGHFQGPAFPIRICSRRSGRGEANAFYNPDRLGGTAICSRRKTARGAHPRRREDLEISHERTAAVERLRPGIAGSHDFGRSRSGRDLFRHVVRHGFLQP